MEELRLTSPGLPLGIWWKIFDLLPIDDKLSSAQDIVELSHFSRTLVQAVKKTVLLSFPAGLISMTCCPLASQ